MRIYVLGDSFANNLYNYGKFSNEHPYNIESTSRDRMLKYYNLLNENNISEMKWFTDWLTDFEYEVFNFGEGGCSIDQTLYQFGHIDANFKEGDRIILWVTNPERFLWIRDDGWGSSSLINDNIYTNENEIYANLLYQQNVNRNLSINRKHGYLNNTLKIYLNYLINIHQKYKPIVISHNQDGINFIKNNKYFFDYDNFSKKSSKIFSTQIYHETNKKINDHHFGRSANYLFAKFMDKIIKLNIDGNYNDNIDLQNDMNRLLDNYDHNRFEIN
jgi:hypothetical protein